MVASYASFNKFYGQNLVSFCLNTEKYFFLAVYFYSQEKNRRFLEKTILQIFKMALCLGVRHIFIWQSLQILNIFNALNLKQSFLKNENLFWKTLVPFFSEKYYYWFIISIKIALSKANVKTNRMGSKKWTYHKESSFAINYFFENLILV